MFSKNPQVTFFLNNDRFGDPQKRNEDDTIWWLDDMDRRGPLLFSFDLKEVFNYSSITRGKKEIGYTYQKKR